mgnify:CR=1 FL=1
MRRWARMTDLDLLLRENHDYHYRPRVIDSRFVFLFAGDIFSVDSIREVICFFNSIIARYKTIPMPVILDLGQTDFSDKLVIILLECVCADVIETYRVDIKITVEPRTAIQSEGLRSSPLLLLTAQNKKKRQEFLKKFDHEIYLNHFRRTFSGSLLADSPILSRSFDDIAFFLKVFDLQDKDREDIAEIAIELIGNAIGHVKADCLLDIDVSRDYIKANADGTFFGVNIGIVNFSQQLLGQAIQEKITQDHNNLLGERYQSVKAAYRRHASYFNELYTEQDFYTIAAFQHKISGRRDNSITGGTGLTGLIKGLQQRSDAHRCYLLSGRRKLLFVPRYLEYNSDEWIGFNEVNDFLETPPNQKLIQKSLLTVPGTAFNLTFILKRGANYDGK